MEKFGGKQTLVLYLKGMAMGAADIVPGVSGGTIAFITGIYQELIDSISAIGPKSVAILFKQGPINAWHAVNGNFLLVLFLGILSSVFTLSKLISTLLATEPELLWSFFFGLILVSALYIAKQIPKWSTAPVIGLVGGALIAYSITVISPATLPMTPYFIFMAGAVAICAMVLPGISGSFILLLMGMYGHIIGAIKTLDLVVLGIFAGGCLCGLLLFTRLLSWLLHHHLSLTLSVLTGFMMGSLNKVWPWKQTLTYRTNSHGEQVPLDQINILPTDYLAASGQDPQLAFSIALMILAIIAVLVLEKWSHAPEKSVQRVAEIDQKSTN